MCAFALILTACGGASATGGNSDDAQTLSSGEEKAGSSLADRLAKLGVESSDKSETNGGETEKENTGDLKVTPVRSAFATEAHKGDIFVEPVKNIPDDFFCGADISSILSEEASGVVYYDAEGNPADLFKILSDAGINYIRVRVWNDPYDSKGNGYGGGNCDADCAAKIGRRAAEYGMKLLVDFHYSDFWADPSKQMVPKAWKDMDYNAKGDAAYEFTKDALNKIIDAGADVGMVQLGNETTTGMSGEKRYDFIAVIMNGGARAVREISAEKGIGIKTVCHLTNPEDTSGTISRVEKLIKNNVDFDILALSYYPFWHGTLENLTSLMTKIREEYGKDVMVAETSYCYTLEEGDDTGNSVSEKDLVKEYTASVQSQSNALRDVCEAVVNAGGLGVFYWEPAWIPVQVYDPARSDAASVLASNKKAWEEKGSGWASSYAKEYDPKDAGKYYGGSSWDNQAWFSFDGHILPSLYTYKYLKYGSTDELKVDFAETVKVLLTPGKELVLPDKAYAHFNDRSKNGEAHVTWDAESLAKVDMNRSGEYKVTGKFDDGVEALCILTLANVNQVKNESFEESDRSMYIIEGNCGDYQQKESDAKTGEWSFHYWNQGEVSFTVKQEIKDLDPGTYSFSVYAQGGDSGADPKMHIFVQVGDIVYRTDFSVDGWINWKHPTVSGVKINGGETVVVGVSIDAGAGAWGTLDDWYFSKTQ